MIVWRQFEHSSRPIAPKRWKYWLGAICHATRELPFGAIAAAQWLTTRLVERASLGRLSRGALFFSLVCQPFSSHGCSPANSSSVKRCVNRGSTNSFIIPPDTNVDQSLTFCLAVISTEKWCASRGKEIVKTLGSCANRFKLLFRLPPFAQNLTKW